MRAISSREAFSRSRNSAMQRWRSATLVCRHDRNASAAASIASRTSSAVDDWNAPRLLPRFAGFSSPKVAPPRDAVHCPAMKLLKLFELNGEDGSRVPVIDRQAVAAFFPVPIRRFEIQRDEPGSVRIGHDVGGNGAVARQREEPERR